MKSTHGGVLLFVKLQVSGFLFVMLNAMRYHLNNLKNMKNTQGGVLLLLKLQASAFQLFAMLSAIWYHLYNLKTMKKHPSMGALHNLA